MSVQKILLEISLDLKTYLKQYNKRAIILSDNCLSYYIVSQDTSLDYILFQKNWENERQYMSELIDLADTNNAIIISELTKEKIYLGEYTKYGYQDVDYFPYKNIWNSEYQQLLNTFSHNNISINLYLSLEWLVKEDLNNQIISGEQDPAHHSAWGRYTKDQRELIAKYYNLYRKRKHKI